MRDEERPVQTELQRYTSLLADPGTGQEGQVASLLALQALEVKEACKRKEKLHYGHSEGWGWGGGQCQYFICFYHGPNLRAVDLKLFIE